MERVQFESRIGVRAARNEREKERQRDGKRRSLVVNRIVLIMHHVLFLSLSPPLFIYLALALVVSSHRINGEREMKRERDGKRELPFVLARLPFFSTRNDRHVVTSRLFYTHLHVRT